MAKELFAKTICPSYFHGNIRHYNLHNLYGLDPRFKIVLRRVLVKNQKFNRK